MRRVCASFHAFRVTQHHRKHRHAGKQIQFPGSLRHLAGLLFPLLAKLPLLVIERS